MVNLKSKFRNVARRTIAAASLVALSPVFAVIATATYIDTGSVFYSQERSGQDAKKR